MYAHLSPSPSQTSLVVIKIKDKLFKITRNSSCNLKSHWVNKLNIVPTILFWLNVRANLACLNNLVVCYQRSSGILWRVDLASVDLHNKNRFWAYLETNLHMLTVFKNRLWHLWFRKVQRFTFQKCLLWKLYKIFWINVIYPFAQLCKVHIIGGGGYFEVT